MMRSAFITVSMVAAMLLATLALADDDQLTNNLSYLSGDIESRHHIYYPGDTLDIRITIAADADLLASGVFDLYLGVFDSAGNFTYSPLTDYEVAGSTRLYYHENLSSAVILPGAYHLALIATGVGGNPGNVADWYNGFAGMLDEDALLYTETPVPADFDNDGEWDQDYDRDGYLGDRDDAHEYYFNTEGRHFRSSQNREWDDDDWDDDSDDDYTDGSSDAQ